MKLSIDFSKLSDKQMAHIIDIFADQHPNDLQDLTLDAHTFQMTCEKNGDNESLGYYARCKDSENLHIFEWRRNDFYITRYDGVLVKEDPTKYEILEIGYFKG